MLITKYNNDKWMKGVIVSRVGKVRKQNGNSGEETHRKNLYTRGKACNIKNMLESGALCCNN